MSGSSGQELGQVVEPATYLFEQRVMLASSKLAPPSIEKIGERLPDPGQVRAWRKTPPPGADRAIAAGRPGLLHAW